jgi:hypothetical protein
MCMLVGSYSFSTAAGEFDATLAERWNGSGWAIPTTPNPPGFSGAATNISLTSLVCASATTCTAAGYYTALLPTGLAGAHGVNAPFVERYS